MKRDKAQYQYCDNWSGAVHYFKTLPQAEAHARANNMGAVSIYFKGKITSTVQGERYFA